jgi:hypothetical protein
MNDELADAEAASPFRLPRLHPGIVFGWRRRGGGRGRPCYVELNGSSQTPTVGQYQPRPATVFPKESRSPGTGPATPGTFRPVSAATSTHLFRRPLRAGETGFSCRPIEISRRTSQEVPIRRPRVRNPSRLSAKPYVPSAASRGEPSSSNQGPPTATWSVFPRSCASCSTQNPR